MTSEYVVSPTEVSSKELRSVAALSPGRYRRFSIASERQIPLRDVLDSTEPYDKGVEPGSLAYVRESPYALMRTGALQSFSFSPVISAESCIRIHPAVFESFHLGDWDLLLSKDSNVGEVGIAVGSKFQQVMPSSGLVRLNLRHDVNRFQLFAFLKHHSFREQLLSLVARGATITHARELWLDCVVPLPSSRELDVFTRIGDLTQAVCEIEGEIERKHEAMLARFQDEIAWAPRAGRREVGDRELRAIGRLDTALYSERYRGLLEVLSSRFGGWQPLNRIGLRTRRGPNLAVSVIGRSMYSANPVAGWYRLIRPMCITEQGTLTEEEYLGSPRDLPLVEEGQIVFGGEATWRSLVVCEAIEHCTTNFHGTVWAWPEHQLSDVIWLRCWIEFLRSSGVLEAIAVGGQGGHLGPDQYRHIPVPEMTDPVRREIASLYCSGARSSPTYVSTDWLERVREWMVDAGIWELDREAKALKRVLEEIQDCLLHGRALPSEL